jgi:hypothetical protein
VLSTKGTRCIIPTGEQELSRDDGKINAGNASGQAGRQAGEAGGGFWRWKARSGGWELYMRLLRLAGEFSTRKAWRGNGERVAC